MIVTRCDMIKVNNQHSDNDRNQTADTRHKPNKPDSMYPLKQMESKNMNDEINRTEAAKLLGVCVSVVKNYPIPFRQYRKNGKAIYQRTDVLAFKNANTHNTYHTHAGEAA